jgi:hypothetical protein
MKQHEILCDMALNPSPGPFLDLDLAARRALIELEACARTRRATADLVRVTWRGGRRDCFDTASSEIDRTVRRLLDDVRVLAKSAAARAAALAEGVER